MTSRGPLAASQKCIPSSTPVTSSTSHCLQCIRLECLRKNILVRRVQPVEPRRCKSPSDIQQHIDRLASELCRQPGDRLGSANIEAMKPCLEGLKTFAYFEITCVDVPTLQVPLTCVSCFCLANVGECT